MFLHSYNINLYSLSSEGEYKTNVTIWNNVSRTFEVTKVLYVQVAPAGLSLDRDGYYTLLDNQTQFTASITAGTGVRFDWNMGDTELYRSAGQCSSINQIFLFLLVL